jgi:hypothetical protein
MRPGESVALGVGVGLAVVAASAPAVFLAGRAADSSAETIPAATASPNQISKDFIPVGIFQQDPSQCYQPTVAEQQSVDQLFSKTPIEQKPPYRDENYNRLIPDVATHFGLTVPSMALQEESETAYRQNYSFPAAMRIANNYLGKFGVSISVAKPGELTSGDKQVPTVAELNTNAALYDIDEITEGFTLLPTQYVHLSGLKHVILAANTGDYAYAVTEGKHNTIAVDVTGEDEDPLLMDHEIYHLLDSAECGGSDRMFEDQGYTDLNGGNIYEGKAWAQNPKVESTLNDNQILDSQDLQVEGEETNDNALSCVGQDQLDQELPRVVAISEYSLDDVAEDKAEMGKAFGNPSDFYRDLSPQMPIVRKKFEYLLARLYHFSPKIVDYFAAVSSRPYPYEFDYADCTPGEQPLIESGGK